MTPEELDPPTAAGDSWDEARPRRELSKPGGSHIRKRTRQRVDFYETDHGLVRQWHRQLQWMGWLVVAPGVFYFAGMLTLAFQKNIGKALSGLPVMALLLGFLIWRQFQMHPIYKLLALVLYAATTWLGIFVGFLRLNTSSGAQWGARAAIGVGVYGLIVTVVHGIMQWRAGKLQLPPAVKACLGRPFLQRQLEDGLTELRMTQETQQPATWSTEAAEQHTDGSDDDI